jgi:hypothetical protein
MRVDFDRLGDAVPLSENGLNDEENANDHEQGAHGSHLASASRGEVTTLPPRL